MRMYIQNRWHNGSYMYCINQRERERECATKRDSQKERQKMRDIENLERKREEEEANKT